MIFMGLLFPSVVLAKFDSHFPLPMDCRDSAGGFRNIKAYHASHNSRPLASKAKTTLLFALLGIAKAGSPTTESASLFPGTELAEAMK